MEDDRPRARPERLLILPLDEAGIEELRTYVAALRAEIARVEAAIARKTAQRGVADAVFGGGGTGRDG